MQERDRQSLRLIQNDDRPRQTMQLSTSRCAGREERLEELDAGSDHEGRIPVLGGEAVELRGVSWRQIRVVFKDGAKSQLTFEFCKDLAEAIGILFDNAGERDDVDHPSKSVIEGVAQSEGE